VVKAKRVLTVGERDGWSLLGKIEAKQGGREIIVMMRDAKEAPQELAERLMRDETIVMTCLNAYKSSKDRLARLLAAIDQAPRYLEKGERPMIAGVKKQQRQAEAQTRQTEAASSKKNPRVRAPKVPPTLAEVVPARDDQQIVLEELKRYLERNTDLQKRFLGASKQRAKEILQSDVSLGFSRRVRKLLAEPPHYPGLLVEAGSVFWDEVHPQSTSTGPTPVGQKPPEILSRDEVQLKAVEKFDQAMEARDKEVADTDTPEAAERREREAIQQEKMARWRGAQENNS
jgi:hypothetical protein